MIKFYFLTEIYLHWFSLNSIFLAIFYIYFDSIINNQSFFTFTIYLLVVKKFLISISCRYDSIHSTHNLFLLDLDMLFFMVSTPINKNTKGSLKRSGGR